MANTAIQIAQANNTLCYGTGLFLETGFGELTSFSTICQTEDGKNIWVTTFSNEDGTVKITVIKGDIEIIKALVQKEMDHFE